MDQLLMNNQAVAASQAHRSAAATPEAQSSLEVPLEPVPPSDDTFVWLIQAMVSALGLILFSPLLVLLALAIKFTDGGPVFYRGERVGRGKRTFKIYKLRTLIEDAEQRIGGRLLSDADRDIYCTKVGRFL
jgi:lipopolysaccharide/colanic/teichoic acid biosynthesis glycosyltransferase